MAGLPPIVKWKSTDANGAPLAGGKLYTYIAGTVTPKATYTDSTGSAANTNPVILDANGEANVWLGTSYYKFVLKDVNDVIQWTVDNVSLPTNAVAGLPTGGTVGQFLTKVDSTNYNGQWSDLATITGTSAAPTSVTAAAGVTFTGSASRNIKYIKSNTGAVTVTASPQIAAGTIEGQELKLIQMSATDTLQFSDGTGLALSGGSILILDQVYKMAVFHWNNTAALWVEQSRS